MSVRTWQELRERLSLEGKCSFRTDEVHSVGLQVSNPQSERNIMMFVKHVTAYLLLSGAVALAQQHLPIHKQVTPVIDSTPMAKPNVVENQLWQPEKDPSPNLIEPGSSFGTAVSDPNCDGDACADKVLTGHEGSRDSVVSRPLVKNAIETSSGLDSGFLSEHRLIGVSWDPLPQGCRYTGNSACGGGGPDARTGQWIQCGKNQRYFTWVCNVLGGQFRNAGCKGATECR